MNSKVTRRQFLKGGGATFAALSVTSTLGFDHSATAAAVKELRIKNVTPTPTVCPYCGSGCGLVVYSERKNGKFVRLLSVVGDPDNPVNQGRACPKGSAMFNLREIYDPHSGEQIINPKRVPKPLYRAAGSDKWEEKDWDWMLSEIAKRVKDTRDNSFEHKEKLPNGREITVNRTEKIASIGGSALDNEECYLLSKMMRSLGVVYLETQARLCHSPSVGGLAPSFGRGVMTNHMIDMKNTNCALIMGSNMAETHPIGMKWLTEGRQDPRRQTKIISVDPRFTRTAAVADLYCPMRSGTDIAFLGGMINYILENNLYHKEYVVNYTNAAFLVRDDFDFKDGLFSGWDDGNNKYDVSSWDYKYDENSNILKDESLQDPRCVFQLMKKHYQRYDIDTVCRITGSPRNKYLEVLKMFCATGAPDKTACICYAMGITQHTVGSENIRAFAIVQLLLGNIGRPGGGINALRGENNVQGATDMALLYQYLPAYIDSPVASDDYKDLISYIRKTTPGAAKLPFNNLEEFRALVQGGIKNSGWRVHTSKWIVSLLKAWYGDAARADNDFAYDYLPKRVAGKNYSHIALFEAMYNGEIEGLFINGSNPVVGGPNANKEQEALTKLKWVVCIDLWLHETAEFWTYKAWERPVENEKVKKITPRDIATEAFFLPAAAVYEKEGTAASTGRVVQFRWKGADPVGESKADLWIYNELAKKIRELYAGSKRPDDEPITRLTWDYDGHPGADEPDVLKVANELCGFNVADGKPVEGFAKLKDDGSTTCGCWVYCGATTWEKGKFVYKTQKREKDDPSGLGLYPNWAWCWPMNRRIVYNRCSVQPDGVTPWPGDDDRRLVWWDAGKIADPSKADGLGCWTGIDVPDMIKTTGPDKAAFKDPFIMRPEGKGCLFAAKTSMKDGPFPEHYEPWESPLQPILNKRAVNPASTVFEPDKLGTSEQYPIIGTTFRLVEHWQTGALTRNLPWLAELMPDMFVELSEELAKEKSIKNGGKVIVSTTRGDIEAVACVTKRVKPFTLDGKTVHEIAISWQYGFKGYATGDPANRLTPHIGDANTVCPEYKAFLCDIRRA
ncbi:MAG: formate dehydrogenase-N subunit alpha [Syntrophomonas sp.]|nr:formate dehydrogenase-N subunit alpha [Eubacteriales bacterium]MDD3880091.1 formate dehydrogenase-N subunit alpha [Syntrophomonas sp.]